jgi:hypothetical protein
MFHDEIPYRVAFERGRIQEAILDTLTENAQALAEIDFVRAEQLIHLQLGPVPKQTR